MDAVECELLVVSIEVSRFVRARAAAAAALQRAREARDNAIDACRRVVELADSEQQQKEGKE